MIVVLALCASLSPGVGATTGNDFTGFGLVCVAETCPAAAACTPSASDQSCTAASASCKWWQSWQVEAGFSAGSGNVTVWVQCGDEELVKCTAEVAGISCTEGPNGGGEDGLGCFIVVVGPVSGEFGACEDPLDPDILYRAIPPGMPYDIDKYRISRSDYAALRAGP